jgi:hypothetical protein
LNFYRNCGIISFNPTNGHGVVFYRRGNSFIGQNDFGKICIRHSKDGGAHWESEDVIFEDSGIDYRNLAGGYDSNGRLFMFYAKYDPGTGNGVYLSNNYRYSDNDAPTVYDWSSEQPLGVQYNSVFSPYGHIIDVGIPPDQEKNTLYQTWFGHYEKTEQTTYTLNLYKSIDGGENFQSTDIINIYSGYEHFSHPSMVNLGGGCFLVLARIDNGTAFSQFKNDSNMVSEWSNPPLYTNFDSEMTIDPGPPWLSFINYQGVGIVACYYSNRNENTLKVVFGLASKLLKYGPIAWNDSPLIEIYPYPHEMTGGYPSFFHPLNQYKGIGNTFEGDQYFQNKIVFTNPMGMIDVLDHLMPNIQ